MKKNFLIVASATICIAICVAINLKANTDTDSELIIASTEALARGEGGAKNTGPAKIQKCSGGETKKYCMCENSKPCTESKCS